MRENIIYKCENHTIGIFKINIFHIVNMIKSEFKNNHKTAKTNLKI